MEGLLLPPQFRTQQIQDSCIINLVELRQKLPIGAVHKLPRQRYIIYSDNYSDVT